MVTAQFGCYESYQKHHSSQLRLETQYTAEVDDCVLVFWFHLYEYILTHKNDCQLVFDNPKRALRHLLGYRMW
jgi:hypothetical protein